MLNRLHGRFLEEYGAAPDFLNISAGAGGRTIRELLVSSDDERASVEDGLATTALGDVFYVPDDGFFRFFENGGDTAFPLDVNPEKLTSKPVFFDNLVALVAGGVREAEAAGYTISDKVVFTWTQGQADPYVLGTRSYAELLDELIGRVETEVEGILGRDIELTAVINQTRGYANKQTSFDQLAVVTGRENTVLGAGEVVYQSIHNEEGGIGHLDAVGYNLFGQRMGDVIYDALHGQTERTGPLIDAVFVSGATVLVTFTGLDGVLVDDASIFDVVAPPEDLGFHVYSQNGNRGRNRPRIETTEIVGPDTVRIEFDRDAVFAYQLALGRGEGRENGNASTYGGTTLRDSVTRSTDTFYGNADVEDWEVRGYAPIQLAVFDLYGMISNPANQGISGVEGASRSLGTDEAETLDARGVQTAIGLGGDDLILASGGDSVVDGGAGFDTVVFAADTEILSLGLEAATGIVTARLATADGLALQRYWQVEAFTLPDGTEIALADLPETPEDRASHRVKGAEAAVLPLPDDVAGAEIVAIGSPGHGRAEIVGNEVLYYADRGYQGPDYLEIAVLGPEGAGRVGLSIFVGEDLAAGLPTAEAERVAYLYEAGLDRNGDIDLPGLNFWIGEREAGRSQSALGNEFLRSPEFTSKNGPVDALSDAELVAKLYANVLDRPGDAAGLDFWNARIAEPGVTRADLLVAFADSPENRLASTQIATLHEGADGEWVFG
ncbi:MAG: DUF4214 domain-containing protein [Paracoccaceae bacterium]